MTPPMPPDPDSPHPSNSAAAPPRARQPVTTEELLFPAADADFFVDWLPPRDNARVPLLAAELSRLAYAPFPQIARETSRIGLVQATPVGGLTRNLPSGKPPPTSARSAPPPTDASPTATPSRPDRSPEESAVAPSAGTEGFWVRDPRTDTIYVVFRGTESGSYEDLVTDLLTIPVPWPGPARVHAGFAAGYQAVAAQMPWRRGLPATQWVLTGHSLGGALATLAATETPGSTRLITFGAPRVGDAAFVQRLAHCVVERYVNCCDLVPRVPPESFEEGPLSSLLTDLLALNSRGLSLTEQLGMQAARGMAGLLARGVATVLRKSGLQAQFLHAGPELYLDQNGRLHRSPPADFVREDQLQARGAYRGVIHREMPALNLQGMFDRLGRLATLSLAGEGSQLVDGLRDLLRDLARSATLANVLLRDLADHAPIGYVHALRQL